MDAIIKKSVYDDDLSGVDMNAITQGKAVVRLYKDLLQFNNIFEALGINGQMILSFPVASDLKGHWIAVLYHQKANSIEHFDSYGYTYQQEIGHTSNQLARRNLLGDLYNKAMDDGVNVICNPYKLQQI
jgi:hypothetical protein